MAVLEAAFGIGRNFDTEVFFIKSVPFCGNFINGEFAGEHLFLDFIADHYVKAIGKLVRFGSDERRFSFVDNRICKLRSDIAVLFREKFFDFRKNCGNESFASSDKVFEESGLAFMDSHGNSAGNNGIFMFICAAEFIKSVAAFVDYGIHGGFEIILVIMGCDANIIFGEFKSEGMLGFAANAMVRVDAHEIHEIFCEFLLFFNGKTGELRKFFVFSGGNDFFDERNDVLTKSCKEFIAFFHCESALIHIELGVIRLFVRFIIFCKTNVIIKNLFEIGFEGFKIVFAFCFVPDIFSFAENFLVTYIFIKRNGLHKFVIAKEEFNFSCLMRSEFIFMFFKVFKKFNGFRLC